MTTKYAEKTTVSVPQSRGEIERALNRYGATAFLYGEQGNRAMVGFEMRERQYRLTLEYPKLETFRYTEKTHVRRTDVQMRAAYEQEIKRRWRGLVLVVKAKLEAVELKVTTVEREFMADAVMANGETVGEWVELQLEQMYRSGTMPGLLPEARPRRAYIEGEYKES